MKKIYKYPLQVMSYQMIQLPKGSKILSVKRQKNDLCLWAIVDTEEEEKEFRHIKCVGTGHEMSNEELKFLDTVIFDELGLVWHIFES